MTRPPRPQPLRQRIVSALRLQPMPARQIATCLSVHYESARMSLVRLERRGKVRRRGFDRGVRPPAQLFEVRS